MASIVLFISLIVLLILNVPIGIAIGISSVFSVLSSSTLNLSMIPQSMVTGTDSFPIMAIPLFILAGELMGEGGVSKRLLKVFSLFFGKYPGGLAIVTVVMCMFFAAVSGSGPATVAAIGTMVVPTMIEKGYDKSFALALVATAGSIGVIIPPSIPMVIYGVTSGTSISALFLGGFLPGILIGISLMIWCYVYCKKMGWEGDDTIYSFKESCIIIWDAKWALINPFIILGGIYGGVFTPTEAASVAAVYAFICGVFIHKELDLDKLKATVASACTTTATVMIILGCATAFTNILTFERVPEIAAAAVMSMSDNKLIVLFLINILLLIVGCFMDTTPAIMILSPILVPIAVSLGVNPVHFGIIMVVNLAIGFITPPLGINLFVAARVGNTTLETITKSIIPFIIIMIICLTLITYIPYFSLFLVNILL